MSEETLQEKIQKDLETTCRNCGKPVREHVHDKVSTGSPTLISCLAQLSRKIRVQKQSSEDDENVRKQNQQLAEDEEQKVSADSEPFELPGGWTDQGRPYEIVCSHGIGHPIPELTDKSLHGCDGCCAETEFRKAKEKYLEKRREQKG